jgi:hypothetical protein
MRPSLGRRLAAIVSLLIIVAIPLEAVSRALRRPLALAAVGGLVVLFVLSLWAAITRARTARAAAVGIALAAVASVAAVVIAGKPLEVLAAIALLVVAVVLGRYALERDITSLKRAATTGSPVGPARHGVLIMNLRSGGGKAERFHLVEECRRRGIEPVVLQPGDDLLDLARGAIDSGADVIGMAGGDGSQALVASVAAERRVPMVVVPAGTRNHLALDLASTATMSSAPSTPTATPSNGRWTWVR